MTSGTSGTDPLDNPAWHALTGPHVMHAEGTGPARRYDADFTPFAALPDDPDRAAWDALGRIIGPAGAAVLVRDRIDLPDGWSQPLGKPGFQMIAPDGVVPVPGRPDASEPIRPLGPGDVDAMLALVALAEPGPFARRTIELGGYVGIFADERSGRDEGTRLVAMAGHRMHLPGITEISAVCTDPEHRGRGHAAALVTSVARGITESGETPILHVATDNVGAIRVYESLGFVVRRTLAFAVVRPPR